MTESAKKSQSVDPFILASTFSEVFFSSDAPASEQQKNSTEQPLEITQLAGDASSRSYHRVLKKNSSSSSSSHLHLEQSKNLRDQSPSWILQCADRFDDKDLGKHYFITGHAVLNAIGVRVPRIVAFSGEKGWILMEDLGDETLQNHPENKNYLKAVDLMIDWTLLAHQGNPHLAESVKKMPQFSWAFDLAKLEFEMGFTAEHLFEKFLGLDSSQFKKHITQNSQYLSEQPGFYCHRDYHCRNLMVYAGDLAVIDFQDARLGPITYDLVSLLWDPYVRLSEELRRSYLDYWKQNLIKRAGQASWVNINHLLDDNVERKTSWKIEIERMKVQRLLKASGSYASFYNVKGRKDYLPSTFSALKDTLIALDNLLTLPKEFRSESDLVIKDEVLKLQKAFSQKMEGMK